ncbi:MAG: tripartite tricarboxylate transporter TctB family protein [Sporomusaceae bacterium]|nr:tripartite tricarboxylate transporter TctB family protein [Sporomusaceae bacterium]
MFFMVLSIAVIYYSLNKLSLGSVKEPGPGFFPFVCGTGITLLCLIWFAVNPRVEKEAAPLWEKGAWVAPVIAMALITLYTLGLETLGYYTSTFLFLIAWQLGIVREKWLKTGTIAIVGTAVMYVLFGYLLGIPVPAGLLI